MPGARHVVRKKVPCRREANIVHVGDNKFQTVDRGSSFVDCDDVNHSNGCFYLAASDGVESDAASLKDLLCPLANRLAAERIHDLDVTLQSSKRNRYTRDYGGLNQLAEEEVVLSHAINVGPIVLVCNTGSDSTATLFSDPGLLAAKPTRFVLFCTLRRHYLQLVPFVAPQAPSSSSSDAKSARAVPADVQQEILEIADAALPLRRLPPPEFWEQNFTDTWSQALANFAATIMPARNCL